MKGEKHEKSEMPINLTDLLNNSQCKTPDLGQSMITNNYKNPTTPDMGTERAQKDLNEQIDEFVENLYKHAANGQRDPEADRPPSRRGWRLRKENQILESESSQMSQDVIDQQQEVGEILFSESNQKTE